MKGLKKLALAAAVTAAPFAQAELTAMDDALLGEMTGQAGLTIDMNLDMSIAEIRYADEDGQGTDVGDAGYLTLSNIQIFGDQGVGGTQALIKGVTIDVDGNDGIVIGFGQIGGQSNASANPNTTDLSAGFGGDPAFSALSGSQVAVLTGNYWTGVNVTADFGINGAAAGSFEVKNFTNFVPNALAMEGVQKFGYSFVDTTGAVTGTPGAPLGAGTPVALVNDATGANLGAIAGATRTGAPGTGGLIQTEFEALVGGGAAADQDTWDLATANVVADGANGFADALAAGTHINASVSISAGGATGTEGLTIDAVVGFVIEEMSYIDDGNKMGIHNFTMYDTDAVTGEITGFKVTGLQIDVIGAADGFVATNSNATAALQISGLNTEGTIAMGDIFIGDHKNGSLGAVAIRDIDMSNTSILIYGH